MADLFNTDDSGVAGFVPLAARMRPRSIDEYVGQEHIVGEGRALRRAITEDRLPSLILVGPPGSGKTTLAEVIAAHTNRRFVRLSAVLSGVKELRAVVAEAREHQTYHRRGTVLFVDEVHRWNRAQQDALLPAVENGTVVLIGATTENPFFTVNDALLSRSRVVRLRALSDEELKGIALRSIDDNERGYGQRHVSIDDDALDAIVEYAGGDARILLNTLESVIDGSGSDPTQPISISREDIADVVRRSQLRHDRSGDNHYDILSALIKSIRGSDPDAALYWCARLVEAGEDPRTVFRRLLISAAEDVGLAQPNALVVTEAAAAAFDRVGMPEGRYLLSEAVLYLAVSPKSNSTAAYFAAAGLVEARGNDPIPARLRDPSRDGKAFGDGVGYRTPHEVEGHFINESYLPESLQNTSFYEPGALGYEGRVAEIVRERRAERQERQEGRRE